MTGEVEFHVPPITREEHEALKAVYAGEATPYQQKLTLALIVNKLARSHDVLYVPGSPTGTAFLAGRGYVGQRVLRFLNLPVGSLAYPQEEQDQ